MDSHQLINQTSKKTEWYTDPDILAAARQLMGGIDLDPASSDEANKQVQARMYFREPRYEIVGEIGGMPVRQYVSWGGVDPRMKWRGRVWLNHPFGQPEQACKSGCTKKGCVDRGWHTHTDLPGSNQWMHHLVENYNQRLTTEAVCLTFSATSEKWFQRLKQFPQIHIFPRLNYFDEAGNKIKGVTKGSCLTYLGKNIEGFAKEFAQWGIVQVPYGGRS